MRVGRPLDSSHSAVPMGGRQVLRPLSWRWVQTMAMKVLARGGEVVGGYPGAERKVPKGENLG